MQSFTGKFIGTTSCGFTTDRIYNLYIYQSGDFIWVQDADGPGVCPYHSMETLIQNWKIPATRRHIHGNL
jgi:hypothetical protein